MGLRIRNADKMVGNTFMVNGELVRCEYSNDRYGEFYFWMWGKESGEEYPKWEVRLYKTETDEQYRLWVRKCIDKGAFLIPKETVVSKKRVGDMWEIMTQIWKCMDAIG